MNQILSPENFPLLQQEIKKALSEGAERIAAFDADGTLWDTDMGENYFQYLIDHQLVPLPKNPMEHYLNMRNGSNPPEGYLWLAQILKNQKLSTVQEWNKKCLLERQPLPIFLEQKLLIDYLISLNFEIWVVTASVKWAVEAPAEIFNIPHSKVIGITTKVIDNLVTAEQDGPITWKEGKPKGLLEKTGGKAPLIAVGNSTGDQYLLSSASHIPIAVRAVAKEDMIFESEQALFDMATANNWHTHDFKPNLRS